MEKLKRLAVFCGANSGISPDYAAAARRLATVLAANSIALVYGGGRVGLMGTLADTMLENNAEVIGVIPQFLVKKELAHPDITQMHVVDSMHERKALMADLADGFILLPGGAGSLDEFFEAFTWGQLGLHRKPYGILNVDHYYDDLLKFLNHAVCNQFIKAEEHQQIIVANNPEELLGAFNDYQAPKRPHWVNSTDQV